MHEIYLEKSAEKDLRKLPVSVFRRVLVHLKALSIRLLKNAHLLRFPHPSSLRRTFKYVSLLRISGALHLGIFEQPAGNDFFSNLL